MSVGSTRQDCGYKVVHRSSRCSEPRDGERFTNERVAKYEPYRASREGNVWHIYGFLPPMTLGGTPEAEVCSSTGEVLHVFHTQ
jgi:hypothetical protein